MARNRLGGAAPTGEDRTQQAKPGTSIIRHSYVAVGSGRRGEQGDGWARQTLRFQNGYDKEIQKEIILLKAADSIAMLQWSV